MSRPESRPDRRPQSARRGHRPDLEALERREVLSMIFGNGHDGYHDAPALVGPVSADARSADARPGGTRDDAKPEAVAFRGEEVVRV